MRKDIREYKNFGVQFSYLLDCIMYEGTDKEKIKFLFDTYRDEYGSGKMSDWLRGLPSAVSLPFSDYDIVELGKSWGYCKSRAKANRFVEEFHNVVAFRYEQLKRYFEL